MKLEFLPEGSADCPLIRLYAFDRAAVLQFNDLVISLATGASTHASLHKQAWIEPVKDCELKLLLGKHDRGISQTGSVAENGKSRMPSLVQGVPPLQPRESRKVPVCRVQHATVFHCKCRDLGIAHSRTCRPPFDHHSPK